MLVAYQVVGSHDLLVAELGVLIANVPSPVGVILSVSVLGWWWSSVFVDEPLVLTLDRFDDLDLGTGHSFYCCSMHWDVDLLWEWAINPKNTEPEKSQREPKPSRRIIQREHLHNLADMSLYKIHATLFGILTTSLAVETLVKFSSVSLIGLGLTRLFESRTTGSMY